SSRRRHTRFSRDWSSDLAAGMIAFFFYGGMLLTVLPHEPGVSWQSHLGGAIGGVLAAWLLRGSDPIPPRRRYSWEIEEEEAERAAQAERDTWEPGSPRDVPVLWNRGARRDDEPGVVLPFRRREDSAGLGRSPRRMRLHGRTARGQRPAPPCRLRAGTASPLRG